MREGDAAALAARKSAASTDVPATPEQSSGESDSDKSSLADGDSVPDAAFGDPILGEMMVMNWRAADLDERQYAMLEFAEMMTIESYRIEEKHRQRLRDVGFSDRDIWDIANVAGFYNMSNRVASATDMRPNDEYHAKSR